MNLNKKNTFTILLFIIILGSVLRFYHLGKTSFVADEFLDINSSYAYAKTGIWQNWDFNFGRVNEENASEARDTRAWVYKWQVAQILKHSRLTEANARIVSGLWGVFSIFVIFYVTTYFTKKKEIGLIAAFLFAISISGIIFNRRLRMYAMFFPVYLLFSSFLYLFLEEEYKGKVNLFKLAYKKIEVNFVYFIPMLFMGIISMLTHQLTGNIIIALAVYSAIQLYLSIKNKNNLLNKYTVVIGAMIFGFIAGIMLFPEKMKVYTKELGFSFHFSYLPRVFFDYSNIIIAIFILCFGIYYLYKTNGLKKESLWVAVSFFAVFFSAMFLWKQATGDQYIFFITSFLIMLISAGIYGLSEFFGKNLTQYKKLSYLIPIVVLLLILPNYGYFFENSNTYRQTSQSDNANYKKVFGYFMKTKKGNDVLVTRNFRNFYWKGAKIKVYDFGGEMTKDKLSLDDIKKIQSENPSGWFIISDNDDVYVSSDVIDYIQKNFERVSNSEVRGKVIVYQWEN